MCLNIHPRISECGSRGSLGNDRPWGPASEWFLMVFVGHVFGGGKNLPVSRRELSSVGGIPTDKPRLEGLSQKGLFHTAYI